MSEPTVAELFPIVQRLSETVQKGIDIQLALSNELAALKGSRAELFSLVSFVLWALVRNSQVNRDGFENDLRQLAQANELNGQEFVAAALRSLAHTALERGAAPGTTQEDGT
jgi:hypothetical protein